MARRPGWYVDPLGPDRLRYRDRAWTRWVVVPGARPESDSVGARRLRRRRAVRRAGVIASVLLMAGCGALAVVVIDDAEHAGIAQARAELDGWRLPPTVGRSDRADRVVPGTFAVSTPTVTRWLDPVGGASSGQALADLVRALRGQGYHLTELPPGPGGWSPTWTGHLERSAYDGLELGLDRRDRRIEVRVELGG